MAKRTFASVTEVPCTCGYLGRLAERPKLPIKFNELFNEYYITSGSTEQDRVEIAIYHCPFCGGAAPESRRGEFFATISDDEAKRLWVLVSGVKTLDDAFRILGTPDCDQPVKLPEGMHYKATRVLTYSRLSTVAEVQVTVHSNNEVEVTIAGKYKGAPSTGA
jgi:hypothetical protein